MSLVFSFVTAAVLSTCRRWYWSQVGSGWVIHHSSSTVSTRSSSFSCCLIQFIQWTFKDSILFTACKMDVCISQYIVTKLFPLDCYYIDIPKSQVSERHYRYPHYSASSSCQSLGLSNVIFSWCSYHYPHNPQTEGPVPGFSVRIYCVRRFGFTMPEVSLTLTVDALCLVSL
jgi:hypothetical protein